jgi:DNA-binding GntR family transcriptional regulator
LHELSAPTLAEQAYDAIRRAITNGELAPGQRITERGLAGMLSVSPTPVREALRRLEQEHLVERRGSRSLVVYDTRESSDYEFALIEASLRSLAVRFTATNATPVAVAVAARHLAEADGYREELRAAIAAGEPYPERTAEMLLLSLRAFHNELESACGNAVLLRWLSTVNAFSFRHRVRVLKQRITDGTIDDDRYLEHRRILDAVERHDADEAERLMLHHARGAAREFAR